jgi:hypothetical protein
MTETEWLSATDPTPMLEFLRGNVSDRKLRLFAVGCCREIWPLLRDERSREVVEVVEQHIERLATDDQLRSASTEAGRAFDSLKEQVFASIVGADLAHQAIVLPQGLFDLTDIQTARDAHGAVDSDLVVQAASAVLNATWLETELQATGYSHLDNAIDVANLASYCAPNQELEKIAQASLLRDIFDNPFRPVSFNPSWLTSTVTTLARQMYDSRDFSPMPILADALQDAGCELEEILNHCRGEVDHVRGCWAVDLILGRL